MPVRKYRSVEDMEDTFWIPPGTPAHRQAVQRVIASVSFFAGQRNLPHGVFKFRSVDEASLQREAWERLAASPDKETV
jgi:hypothetical protein